VSHICGGIFKLSRIQLAIPESCGGIIFEQTIEFLINKKMNIYIPLKR
jgi:hypothetical protein